MPRLRVGSGCVREAVCEYVARPGVGVVVFVFGCVSAWLCVWVCFCVRVCCCVCGRLCGCLHVCLCWRSFYVRVCDHAYPATPLPPTPHTRYLVEDEYGQVWTGGSTYADLPIHMHMANSFLFGRNRVVFFNGMHSPVFAGEVRRCPVLRCLWAPVPRCLWAVLGLPVGCMWAPVPRCLYAVLGLSVGSCP